MDQALFCVTCMVDNGCTHERHEMYVFAFTGAQARRTALQHWNEQYDTVATIETTKIIPHLAEDAFTGNIICTKRVK